MNGKWKASAESGSVGEEWMELDQWNKSYPTPKYWTKLIDFSKKKKSYMSYLNQVWMVASMAVVQGHTNQGHKWKTGIKSLQHGKQKFFSDTDSDASDLWPLSGMIGSDPRPLLGDGLVAVERVKSWERQVRDRWLRKIIKIII